MQTAANTSLVLTDASSFKRFTDSQTAISYGRFYQRFASEVVKGIHTKQTLSELGERLIVLAEHAHAFRQMDALEQVSQFLMNSPLPRQYEAIGQYYQALCTQMLGRGDVERAASLLENVVEGAPPKYMIRAIISLAANFRYQGDNESALSVYCEAGRFASRNNLNEPYSIITAQRMFAVIKSEDGNHRGALALLENLFPLAHAARSSQPHVYYDYMNSLAVELCEVGRLEEAKNVSQIVHASPFAAAYPEWRETGEEIELRGRRASRSTVGFSHSVAETVERIGSDESSEAQKPSSILAEFAADSVGVSQGTAEPSNILSFPVREQRVASGFAAYSSDTREPARVLIMSERNKAVGKDSNETRQRSYEDLDGRQLLLKIMELTAAKDITDYELLEILKSIEGILFRQQDPGKR